MGHTEQELVYCRNEQQFLPLSCSSCNIAAMQNGVRSLSDKYS